MARRWTIEEEWSNINFSDFSDKLLVLSKNKIG